MQQAGYINGGIPCLKTQNRDLRWPHQAQAGSRCGSQAPERCGPGGLGGWRGAGDEDDATGKNGTDSLGLKLLDPWPHWDGGSWMFHRLQPGAWISRVL